MDRISHISKRVIEYYAANPPVGRQIMHTQSVAHFTRLISRGDELQEIAAWLHDIGCPPAVRKYGDSLPPHQETEGEKLAREWLAGDSLFAAAETAWLAGVVGGHHRLTEARRLGFEPLYEADLIVNLFEGYYPPEQAKTFFESGAVGTEEGRRLFQTLFGV